MDDNVDDIHIHPDHPLGLMEITDECIHTMHIIPHITLNDDIQFRALKLDSSLPNNTEDHAHSPRATVRTCPYLASQCVKKRVPKSLLCPVSAMSMTELEVMIADFNKLPPTEYQATQHVPNLLKQKCVPRHSVVFNVALVFFQIMMLHVHNNFDIIRRCITTSRVHNATAILGMFGFGLSPRSAGEAQLFWTSPNPLHLSGPQVSTCQIHSNTTVNDSHNLSDAPVFFVYS